MERFAFKIDASLKANLYKICRLCGIDNPSKVPILPNGSEILDLDEPSLGQKIYELVGFLVKKSDKMPQTICSLCEDKINDFYEFREMCYATNTQTRKLLGVKQADPQKLFDVKPIVKTEPLSIASPKTRGRKRKTEDNVTAVSGGSNNAKTNASEIALNNVKNEPVTWRKKQKLQQQQKLLPAGKEEIKDEPIEGEIVSPKASLMSRRCKASCSVCGERFINEELAEQHKSSAHIPSIARYICVACNQCLYILSDIKAHQLWHKLSKTPYQCPICDVNINSNYAYTRHMREHTLPTPIESLVLDRECPICKKTFITNFLYNTHLCARRTHKCGGCDCKLTTHGAYLRHAPFCPQIYLHHSKHIMPEAAKNEAQIRIKNEYDVEDDASLSTACTEDKTMQPVVMLERLTTPLLHVSAPYGKSSDRVSSKKYLKRVDQLLKNTMSTLVSIKHEPEVHIDDTEHPSAAHQSESEPNEDIPGLDDFHANAGDDDSDEDVANADNTPGAVDSVAISVKQEIIDESYEKDDSVQFKQEPLKLKLKITKNHGQLNSSIVDEDNDMQVQSKSSKKKKKRKHKERNKESDGTDEQIPITVTSPEDVPMPSVEGVAAASSTLIAIKQERMDDNYSDVCSTRIELEPQATVMTSIPILQLESNCGETQQEPEDVKPNRLELDRLMQITHIAGGVVLAEEALPPETAVEAMPSEAHVTFSSKRTKPNATKVTKSTARKSTGGLARETAASSNINSVAEKKLLKIVAVESIDTVPFNLVPIKPEPLDRGYADECEEQRAVTTGSDATNEINHNEKIDEEAAYIRGLDLSNVTIKQERDLQISDVDINGSEYNGFHENDGSEDDEDDDDSASSADEAEENLEDQEERIYCELDLPPLEEQTPIESTTAEAKSNSQPLEASSSASVENPVVPSLESQNLVQHFQSDLESEQRVEESSKESRTEEPNASNFNFVITSVCSQAEPLLPANEQASNGPQSPVHETSQKATVSCEEKITSPVVTLNSPKDNETLAQPFFNTSNSGTNDTCDEEQQNLLNHELSATVEHVQIANESTSDNEQEAGPSTSACCESRAHEETENLINEQQQQVQQVQQDQQVQLQQRCQVNNDSNINEIAENNNNANIERELNDDANVAQENADII